MFGIRVFTIYTSRSFHRAVVYVCLFSFVELVASHFQTSGADRVSIGVEGDVVVGA